MKTKKASGWKLTAEQARKLENERFALEALAWARLLKDLGLMIRIQSEMAQKEIQFGPNWYLT